MINRVLVAVDDSNGALAALQWTESLVAKARSDGNTPSAVVMTAWSRPLIDTQAIFEDGPFQEAALATLDNLASKLANPDWFEKVARRGHPAEAIIIEANDRDVDLIVIGSRGRSPIAQVLLGSVSRVVAGRAKRPVAIVPEPSVDSETGSDSNRKATEALTVVGYDDSSGSRAALRWALDNLTGEILVVSVWCLPNTVTIDADDPRGEQMRAATERALLDGVAEVCGGSIEGRVTPLVRHGDPRLAILDSAPAGSQIVLGARGERGLRGLLLGSTVTYVAAHSSVPVIIVPPSPES